MKVTKVPGFGSYGCYVDNFEYDSIAAWKELQKINLKNLITIVRGNGTDKFKKIYQYIPFIGKIRYSKYVASSKKTAETKKQYSIINPESNENYLTWHRVSGKKDQNNRPLGLFGETELLWHSDESGRYEFLPLTVLYGNNGMRKSATGFIQFADWFNQQTESFKSELREMRVVHGWKPYSIEPQGTIADEEIMKESFLHPLKENAVMPLVMHSPGGIEGLHYSVNSILKFNDMSKEESDSLINRLNKELFVDQYKFNYWWENDRGDFILFDNSITIHNRMTDPNESMTTVLSNREAFRIPLDYASCEDYDPFNGVEPFTNLRKYMIKYTNPDGDSTYCAYILKVLESLSKKEKENYIINLPKIYQKRILKFLMKTDV